MTWVTVLASVVALAALAWAAYLSQQLGQTQQEMARRSADAMVAVTAANRMAEQSEALAKDLESRLGVVELRLSEVALQRAQLEELMLSVSRSRDDSLVQDIESTLRLAFQQSELTGSAQPLISALQGAEQRIARAAQPRLNPVQRAIARDIERLRAAELIDVPALVARIDELRQQVDDWPLRNDPWTMPAPYAAVPKASAPLPLAAPAVAPPPDGQAPAPSTLGHLWLRFSTWSGDLLARAWAHIWHSTAQLFRLSRIDQPEAALLAPEQSFLLRESIKSKLLNARLGLLGREIETAKSDILTTRHLLERYFDHTAPATQRALLTLTQLHEDMGQDGLPRPDETLGALAVAASGR